MCVCKCLIFACASKERAACHDEHIDQLPGHGFELGIFMCACASI